MWEGPQRPDHRGTKAAHTLSDRRIPELFARHRADIGNIPAHIRKCLDGRNDPNNDKREMNQHADQTPENGEKYSDCRNTCKNHVDDGVHDIKEEPGAAEDD